MEKTIKVSIGGTSFTLEEKAYAALNEYLGSIESHYRKTPNGKEITDGIEERMAELLTDAGGKGTVISSEMVRKAIETIGRPEEIDSGSDSEAGQTGSSDRNGQGTPKKKFHRNPDDKKVAGVCGGIAAYFRIDPLWLRAGFLLMTVLASATSCGWWNLTLFPLIYLILWICIPEARTTAQKCAMKGETMSYQDIERSAGSHTVHHSRSAATNILGITAKIILIFFGLILLIIGLACLFVIVAALFGVAVAGAVVPGFLMDAVNSFLAISPAYIILTKILAVLVLVLPVAALLYGGVKLIFSIKSPKWRPGLIMLLVWCLSVAGLMFVGIKVSSGFRYKTNWESSQEIAPSGDTVYVRFSGPEHLTEKRIVAEGDREEYHLLYVNTAEKDSILLAMYPSIELNRGVDSTCSVDVSSILFEDNMTYEERIEKEKLAFFSFSNDTLTVSPLYYGRGIPVTEIQRELTITVPEGVNVVIPGPIRHQFDTEFERFDTREFDKKTLHKIHKMFNYWKMDPNIDGLFDDDDDDE